MRIKNKKLNESEKLLSILNLLDERETNDIKKEYLGNIIKRLERRIGKEDVNEKETNE